MFENDTEFVDVVEGSEGNKGGVKGISMGKSALFKGFAKNGLAITNEKIENEKSNDGMSFWGIICLIIAGIIAGYLRSLR